MKVLVDESYHQIDEEHYCFVVAHILASDEAINEFLKWYKDYFLPDSMRYKHKDKVHYTDEDTATKQILVEAVKSLGITAKMYAWYGVGAIQAADIIEWSIGYQRQANQESEFYVEESGVLYEQLRSKTVRICKSSEHPELGIPDIFAGAYIAKILTKRDDIAANRSYRFLYPRIRFEVKRDFDGRITKSTRSHRTY